MTKNKPLSGWSPAKAVAFVDYGGLSSYRAECFDYWTDENGVPKREGYTNDDEYGNQCFAPADEACPVCHPSGESDEK